MILAPMVCSWFACGSPFTKTTEITRMTKTTRIATVKELSVGLAEAMEMTKTTEIRVAKHGFPKQRV